MNFSYFAKDVVAEGNKEIHLQPRAGDRNSTYTGTRLPWESPHPEQTLFSHRRALSCFRRQATLGAKHLRECFKRQFSSHAAERFVASGKLH